MPLEEQSGVIGQSRTWWWSGVCTITQTVRRQLKYNGCFLSNVDNLKFIFTVLNSDYDCITQIPKPIVSCVQLLLAQWKRNGSKPQSSNMKSKQEWCLACHIKGKWVRATHLSFWALFWQPDISFYHDTAFIICRSSIFSPTCSYLADSPPFSLSDELESLNSAVLIKPKANTSTHYTRTHVTADNELAH